MRLKDLIDTGMKTISLRYPEREAREMVLSYLEDNLGVTRYAHILEPSYEVLESDAAKVLDGFGRMAGGEPLQYVSGHAHFYGRLFRVTPDVLIPRQETELLCRYVFNGIGTVGECSNGSLPISGHRLLHADEAMPFPRLLDMCTGSGCIAWTLALEMPGAEVTAVDISDGALAVASLQDFGEEMTRSGALPPTFMKADVLAPPPFSHKFDIIVSNPPYVMDKEKALMRPNVLEHEPHLALFVPDDDPLLFYRAVARWSSMLLSSDGFGIVEINEALGQETKEVFCNAGFSSSEVLQDLSSKDRFVKFAW